MDGREERELKARKLWISLRTSVEMRHAVVYIEEIR